MGFKDAQDLVDARTLDISLGGVCLRGPIAAVPGDEMLVLVSLKDRIVPALATVVRSENISAEEVKLHLEFNWFSDFGRDKLARLTRVTPRDALGEAEEAELEQVLEEMAEDDSLEASTPTAPWALPVVL